MQSKTRTINAAGRLIAFDRPLVMGILNVTPDSFYQLSRKQTDDEIARRARNIIEEGGDIIDIGACSTRPGSSGIPLEEEMKRLRNAMQIVRMEVGDALCSVDTYRADVARMCVEEYGVGIVNDISAGELDEGMFDMVARLKTPYVAVHMKGTPKDMQLDTGYEKGVIEEATMFLSEKIEQLRSQGVADIIIDPGFGFGKSLDDNYRMMQHLDFFKELDCPVLVGISRKSMICNVLGITPDDALNGTTVLNTVALLKGADILRVHDVKQAVETIKLTGKITQHQLQWH